MANPIAHVEIPVLDLDRAEEFYARVFGYDVERTEMDGYVMAFLPFDPAAHGAGAALVAGDVYRPGHGGAVVYHRVGDLDATLARAADAGAPLLYGPVDNGPAGRVAEIEDSEGNRVALLMPAPINEEQD